MRVVKAPSSFTLEPRPWVFLAGSIEMGAAEDWQSRVADSLQALPGTILNPRRDDWDSSWKQDIADLQFRQQVEWELAAMEVADKVLMHFCPSTKSPITLLELGLNANKPDRLVVSCPEGFWRRGNVQIICAKHVILLCESLDEALGALESALCRMVDTIVK